jgi:hypothetical protein
MECEPELGFKRAIERDGEEIHDQLRLFMEVQVHYEKLNSPMEFADFSIPFKP